MVTLPRSSQHNQSRNIFQMNCLVALVQGSEKHHHAQQEVWTLLSWPAPADLRIP